MSLKEREDIGNLGSKHWMASFGELAVGEAMGLS